jgi:hypothetical protein
MYSSALSTAPLSVRMLSLCCRSHSFFAVSAPVVDRGLGFLKIRKRTVAVLIVGGIVALGLGWFLPTYSFIDTLEYGLFQYPRQHLFYQLCRLPALA